MSVADISMKQVDAQALDRLLAAARARHEEFSAQTHISADVVQLMKQAGVYRAMVAKRFGGDELHPSDFLRLIETISEADGATGWVASFGFSAVYLSSLPLATLEAMYADGPDVVFAGGIFPPQPARRVDGGLEVSGRWSWGSGCRGAEVIGVGVKAEGAGAAVGLPLIAVMPASRVQIVDNWDVIGMRGTGSHDMVVDRVVVPDEWTFIRGGPSILETPLYRYPSMPLAAQVLAVVGLGVARASLDYFTGFAGGRSSITGAPVLGTRSYVQTDLAKAEAKLRSARAFLYEITDQAFDLLRADEALDVATCSLLRLAATNAAHVSTEVTQTVYRLSGTAGITTGSPVARHMQDAMIVPQHAFLADSIWQNAGKILLGMETTPGFP
ncbi:acyl-CoA dehydrogenase family protein [Sphingobium sp. YR768]|uniref:acyl-CoA dehydrogenase family protein n=1 Tax=Sphingobium sp. YR768 TaxID=1884365 RepID=UPI0008C9C453|nr:acyl-CoA dehydrogenase family protein [Sphingobium sp. YR768]SER29756.1 Acyl-CoA dehydrogenase [Sphingobium sp. YR768]